MCFMFFFLRYVIVYFGIMYIRHRAGIVTDEMLSLPKTPFVVIGLLEALAAATGMAAGGSFPLFFLCFGLHFQRTILSMSNHIKFCFLDYKKYLNFAAGHFVYESEKHLVLLN